MKKTILLFLLFPSIAFGYGYPTVPNAFIPNTTILSAKVNANFSAILTGFSSGSYKANFAELYVAGYRLSDANRNLLTNNLNVTGSMVISGTLRSVGAITGTLATPAQPSITSVGALASLAVSGNAVITGTLRSVGAITGTLATPAQPNITHTGTLSTLNVSGAVKLASTLNVTGNAVITGTLRVVGGLSGTLTGGLIGDTASSGLIKFANNKGIVADTSDGADTSEIFLSGGGSFGLGGARGSYIDLSGNESGNYGTLGLYAGLGDNATNCGVINIVAKGGSIARFGTAAGLLKSQFYGELIAPSLNIAGNIKGTLTTAGQTAITSVGTLTGLTVSGGLNVGSATGAGAGEIRNDYISITGSQINNWSGNADDSILHINYNGYNGGTTKFRDTQISNGKNVSVLYVDGSAENVGIGTTTPGYKLQVTSSAVYGTLVGIQSTNTGGNNWVFQSTDNSSSYGGGKLVLSTVASGQVMTLQQNGNVGIGTTTPGCILETQAAGDTRVQFKSKTATTGISRIYLIAANDDTKGGFFTARADGSLDINTYGQGEMTLRAGNVGIGTTSPATTLDVSGDSRVRGDLYTVARTDYFSTSTKTGWSASPTGYIYYKKIGNLVFVQFYITGTSNGTDTSFTITNPPSTTGTIYSSATIVDNGTTSTGTGRVSNAVAAGTINIYKDMAGGAWTSSGTKSVFGQFFYTTD